MKLDLSRGKGVTQKVIATSVSATKSSLKKNKSLSSAAECPHVAILRLGVSIWNQWRASEPLITPNLQKADLSGLTLENVNLSGANLRGANLDNAYLYDADFQKADLRGASLKRAVLIGANLYKANLASATLEHSYLAQSDLSNANFTNACLKEGDLHAALLTQTIFANASIEAADLTDCCDLSELQLKASRDGHLAYLSDDVCSLPKIAEASDESVPTGTPMETSVENSKRPIDVYRPARQPSLTPSVVFKSLIQ